MTIEEFLKELYGHELSDMFAGNRNSPKESRPKLLPLLNSALEYAYSKWTCKTATAMLDTVEGTYEYVLPQTDILQVLQLVNVYGVGLLESEYQVRGQTIYFPRPATQTLQVVYKTIPTKMLVTQDDATVALEVPVLLVPWVKAWVCWRYFAPMVSEEGKAKALEFLNQANLAEALFVSTNTTNEFTAVPNTKMEARGFA